MKNESTYNHNENILQYEVSLNLDRAPSAKSGIKNSNEGLLQFSSASTNLPEILFITSYPPRECGIATYSHDLALALKNKFGSSFRANICALETDYENHRYPENVKYIFNTCDPKSYPDFSNFINAGQNIKIVVIQHEFGFFNKYEDAFRNFLYSLTKPIAVVFHTVLPQPNESLKSKVQDIAAASESIIVMTRNSAELLEVDYDVPRKKIKVIPHGTHLVPYLDKNSLKEKYGLTGKRILSTFGLLSEGKGIETSLDSLPTIIKTNPDVIFLVLGKTHPSVIKNDGEKYRSMLESKVRELKLENHVVFINKYLQLPELLEYLQLTDVYLFTSKDPNQAVSGTFSYAISCGCAIISTPIPHAREMLRDNAGIFIDFDNSKQLTEAVNRLLYDENLRKNISLNGLHKIVPTAWENSAISHAELFLKMGSENITLKYSLPDINLDHIKKLTTDFGMIQFSHINNPDLDSGYTLDDNARALVALCQHYELTKDKEDIKYIKIYFNFIKHCLRPEGYFLNYVNHQGLFTGQNNATNLADANGRAVWALGYMISLGFLIPKELRTDAAAIIKEVSPHLKSIHSTRAMAFVIKGLCYSNSEMRSKEILPLLTALANRLLQMYKHESDKEWKWFESYLTYANAILPEAMLCAYLATGEQIFKTVAKESFDFLLSNIYNANCIKVISNKSWLHKGEKAENFGEQPIDVAYTILALNQFYREFKDENYLHKMRVAFNWFLGNNHLHQVIYNPCTGGCYDGLEEDHVNLNQGAESTVSYLMSRLTIEKYSNYQNKVKPSREHDLKSIEQIG